MARKLFGAALACAAMVATGALAQSVLVRDMGSYTFGGRYTTITGQPVREYQVPGVAFPLKEDPNGEYLVEQMYVQYVRLAKPISRYPILFIHGGGMTGSTWETTPDGRPGWQSYFLRHGYSTFVGDAVERGRSGTASPLVWSGKPVYPQAKGTWEFVRIGARNSWSPDSAVRTHYPDSKFPFASFDTLMRMRVPSYGVSNYKAQVAAYDEAVQKLCPCILIAHSTGGVLAEQLALDAPSKVRAVVALEPAGAPGPTASLAAKVKGVPHLWIWGDHLADDPVQQGVMPASRAWWAALRSAGGTADWIDLPAKGIKGNTHVLMMDTNSDQIAGLVEAWLAKNRIK